MNRLLLATLFALPLALAGCGSDDVELGDDGGTNATDADPSVVGDADPNAPDANPNAPDAAVTGCSATGEECNNCVDDDMDGFIDGADPECTSFEDRDESSFATGIPGDNSDAVKQDCFFDGDSGAGNDGCDIHVCCLLSPGDAAGCPDHLKPDQYDPADCAQTQECTDKCGSITPPGCDCFGCCTVCTGTDCVDVLTNPLIYTEENCSNFPNPAEGDCCEQEHLEGCYTCTKSTDCGGATCDDDPDDCILCPGQTDADLPDSCTMQECPAGIQSCDLTEECGADQYCANGCCTDAVIID